MEVDTASPFGMALDAKLCKSKVLPCSYQWWQGQVIGASQYLGTGRCLPVSYLHTSDLWQ